MPPPPGGPPAALLHLPPRGLPQPVAWELGHHGARGALRCHPVQRTRRVQASPGSLLWLPRRVSTTRPRPPPDPLSSLLSPCSPVFFNLIYFYLFILREGGREGEREERERNINRLLLACILTRDLACNPVTCPDWELNRRPFILRDSAQPTEPASQGLLACLLSHAHHAELKSPEGCKGKSLSFTDRIV